MRTRRMIRNPNNPAHPKYNHSKRIEIINKGVVTKSADELWT